MDTKNENLIKTEMMPNITLIYSLSYLLSTHFLFELTLYKSSISKGM